VRPLARSLAVLLCLLLGPAASAYLPSASRIANEVAKTNREAGRAVPLALSVDLRMGEVDAVLASGTLVSDPAGPMRLELQSPRGTWERHLRRGTSLRATRLGEIVERPRPFLAPVFLLQAGSGGSLRTGLVGLGGRANEVGLGYEGASDCWVLGGRTPGPATGGPDRAAIWIDQESLQVVRVDQADGVSYRLGPPQSFGKIAVPSWIDIRVAGVQLGRLVVTDAKPTRAPASAFAPAWLRGPAAD
jgi:hypothetical protein